MKNLLAVKREPQFEYTIKKSAKARRVKISITGSGEVLLTVPRFVPNRMAEIFLNTKKDWIVSKINEINSKKVYKNLLRFPQYKTSREEARKIITDKVREMNQFYNLEYGRIAIKNQKTCWGSCSRRKNLNFNYKVAYLPQKMMGYIVVHELCHLREMNHSHKFWALVAQVFPDYKKIHKEMREKGYNLS